MRQKRGAADSAFSKSKINRGGLVITNAGRHQMELIKNLTETKYGLEGKVYCALYGEFISLIIETGSNVEFAEKCAVLLNELSEPVLNHLCRASERYCNDFLDDIGETPIEFKTNRSVLERTYPVSLIVPVPNDAETPVVHMELNCDWEEEHGMEWLIRNNKVLYVGGFNGCYAYNDFLNRDGWNYAWQTVDTE